MSDVTTLPARVDSSTALEHRPATPHAMRVEDVCDALGLCRTTVNKLVRDGELRSFTIGRARRFTPEAVADFMATREAANR